jgi:hypothetical protein
MGRAESLINTFQHIRITLGYEEHIHIRNRGVLKRSVGKYIYSFYRFTRPIESDLNHLLNIKRRTLRRRGFVIDSKRYRHSDSIISAHTTKAPFQPSPHWSKIHHRLFIPTTCWPSYLHASPRFTTITWHTYLADLASPGNSTH